MKVVDELSSHFKLKKLGKVRFILGIEVGYEIQMKQLKISQMHVTPEWLESKTKSVQNRYIIQVWKDKMWLNVKGRIQN